MEIVPMHVDEKANSFTPNIQANLHSEQTSIKSLREGILT